jgi:hypothetical protein
MRRKSFLGTLAALFIAIAIPVLAHGGFEHVIGNVVKVSNNVLTVKTSTGNVDVKLDAKTEITKDKAKAQLADLAPGARVVIDVPEESKEKIAHAVKISTTGAVPVAEHDEHAGHDGH